ncbi:MAG: Gldg family protein [Anaerolineae bacterium]|nr:Gldg family protein [Anaerolineae bacterium]
MKQVLTITKKELRSYFGSPMAIIFVGTFLAATLFSFFWMETFFARGIADVRPLFRWMPALMIFLVAALTMRQWSEEQRVGTLEILLTLPVSTVQLVVGKFLAVVALMVIALALTIFLPITVSILGNLDWGPVFGGYLAAVLLAGAYAAIGLFVSSRTDNQIVALIVTVLLCGLFYLVGSSGVTDFFGNEVGELLRAIGSGSRFESIQRGVIDLRDLLYYITLAGIFLTLNVLSLKAKGWSEGSRALGQRRAVALTSALLVVNLLVVNVWMYPLRRLRVDLTQYQEYSLSRVTRDLLTNLREPLTIRAYFSKKTHPLLAPLVPTVRDMLQEYEIAAGGKVRLEIIDPTQEPEKEAEANQIYGISPTPFQISDRYEASVVNSYFDILILYGDQNATLGFDDLIEVQSRSDGVDVTLRNLEYDLTSTIKKTVYGFQDIDTVLASFAEPVQLTAYITPKTLPAELADAPATIATVAQQISEQSGGKFVYTEVDPTAADSPVSPEELYETFGLQPLLASFFSSDTYYLYMVLTTGDTAQVVYPSGEISESEVRKAIESSLKRSASGFLTVVGVWSPPETTTQDMFGQQQESLSSWDQIRNALGQEYEVQEVDLTTGIVPADVDVLLVIAPQNFTDKEVYAIDQYLMRGGAVFLSAGNFTIMQDPYTGGLGVQQVADGLQDLLTHYGITVESQLVLDQQNEPFPLPVVRQVGNYQVQEIQALDYPFFVDVRSDGMAEGSPVVANLSAITLNWSSPITVDEEKNVGRTVEVLLSSTEQSWVQSDTNINPDFETYPDFGFAVGSEQKSYPLAVSVQGSFESYFTDKPSPFEATEEETATDDSIAASTPEAVPGTITVSPETSRLLVVSSAEFLDDIVLELSTTLSRDRYLNSFQLVQNAIAWATEDLELLDIRARGTTSRVLNSLDNSGQSFWEIANYIVALVALLTLGGFAYFRQHNEAPLALEAPKQQPHPSSGRSE